MGNRKGVRRIGQSAQPACSFFTPFSWLRPELLECEPEMIGADGVEVAVLQSEEAKDFKEDLILRWGSFMRVSEAAPPEEPTGKSCYFVKIR